MIKNFLYSIGILAFIGLIATVVILYGRGYRFNLQQKSITPTGILSVSSVPEGASVWLDGKLITATNGSISYKPGWYTLRIGKEGYQSWEKKVRIQGEVVTRADALLIPNNPSLRTLTLTGIYHPVLSPTGDKVAFIVPVEEASFSAKPQPKRGVWVMELKNGPLGGKSEPKAVYQSDIIKDWSQSSLIWSPDEKQILLKFITLENKKELVNSVLLLNSDIFNIFPQNVTLTWQNVLADWKSARDSQNTDILESLPKTVNNFLETSASDIHLSPDDGKIMYIATRSAALSLVINPPLIGGNSTVEIRNVTPDKLYIYDIKEDKNYFIADTKTFSVQDAVKWYSDSKHIIMIEKASIYIIDYDGTNKRALYSGPFEDNIVYPWTTPGKVVILTNFNKPNSLSNFYEIDLR